MARSEYGPDPAGSMQGGSPQRGVKVTFIGLMVVCGLLMIVTGVLFVRNAVELVAVGQAKFFGTETRGTVVEKLQEPGEGRQIEYTYVSTDGRSFTKRVSVGAAVWERLEAGSPVDVRYAAGTPSASVLAQGDRIFWWVVLRLLAQGLFLVLLGYGIREAWRFSRDMKAYS